MAGGLAVFLLAGNLASAGTINQREWRQQERIWRGYRSGDLTPREFRRLEREQALIRRSEARARRDCDFTARERMRIQPSKTAPAGISSVNATTANIGDELRHNPTGQKEPRPPQETVAIPFLQ